MKKLYKHQQDFIDKNPNKALLGFDVGTGKTLTAIEWLRTRQDHALVVVPKRIVEKWKDELEQSGVKATVVTKEEFKKLHIINEPSAFVFDEAHYASAPLFTKSRSQLAEKTYNLIKRFPKMPVLMMTATIISSNPANLHTLLCYIGVYIPWRDWQNKFYELKKMPYMPRPAWIPTKNWRKDIRPVLSKHAHFALMRDCVDLPPEQEEVIKVKTDKFIAEDWEATKAFVEEHRHEQKNKPEIIREIGSGYRKVVVVAHFREQIDQLYKELSKDKQTYVLHGGIKDQEEVIRQAQEDDECYIIIQYSCGVGFDLDTFAVMIFASQGYSYVSLTQMKGRIQRIKNIHPCKYIYLVAGRVDKAIRDRLLLGQDFDPKYFL